MGSYSRVFRRCPVSWPAVGTLTGWGPATEVLPIDLECPKCSNRSRIVPDIGYAGQWWYCHSCGVGYDPLQLFSTVKGISLRDGLRHFGDALHSTADAQEYVQHVLAPRRRWLTLWGLARKQLLEGGLSRSRTLMTALRFHQTMPDNQRWAQGPSQIYGYTSRRQIDQTLHSRDLYRPAGSPKETTGLLVVPYYDQPYRVCGYMTHDSRINDDGYAGTYASVYDQAWNRPFPELGSGLAMHPAVVRESERLGYVVAIADDVWMLRLQQKHFGFHVEPLPLVAWSDREGNQPELAWRMFGNCRRIFWMHGMSLETVRQAVVNDGELCDTQKHSLRRFNELAARWQPEEMMDHLQYRAVPWDVWLAKTLHRQDQANIDSILFHLKLDTDQQRRLIDACRGSLKESLKTFWRDQPAYILDERLGHVFERDSGIYRQRARANKATGSQACQLLSNVRMVVKRIIFTGEDQPLHYEGELKLNGQAAQFAVTENDMVRNWLTKFCLANDLGTPECAMTPDRLLSLCVRLSRPETIKAPRSGWNSQLQEFHLPGVVYRPHQKASHTRNYLNCPDPGWDPLVALDDQDWLATINAQTLGPFWIVAMATLSNLLASMYGESLQGYAFHGPHAADWLRASRDLTGIEEVRDIDTDQGYLDLSSTWPKMYELHPKANIWTRRRLETVSNANLLVAGTRLQATALGVSRRWPVLELRGIPKPMSPGRQVSLRRLLGNYLQDLFLKGLKLRASGSWELLNQVTSDFRIWAERRRTKHGFGSSVRPIQNHLHRGYGYLVGSLLGQLVVQGVITLGRQGFQKDRFDVALTLERDRAYVPALAISIAARKCRLPEVSPEAFEQHLKQADLLRGKDETGWWVPIDWLTFHVNHEKSLPVRVPRLS